MTTHSFPLVTAAGMLALFAAPCPAQPPFTSRPTVSPYLNLLRSGGSPALNYYTLVRPQNQFYQSLRQLQQDVGANAQELNSLQQSTTTTAMPMRPTGFAAGFMTQSQYFMNFGAGVGGTRPGQVQAPTFGQRGMIGTGYMGSQAGMVGGRPPGSMGGGPNFGGRMRGY
jgi:hypothetical protein